VEEPLVKWRIKIQNYFKWGSFNLGFNLCVEDCNGDKEIYIFISLGFIGLCAGKMS